ncbi:YbaN family protein [Virgibacillus sp. DJP39]|uniref:YbaN family protein n=1 Tax=Virgibacillus sp. DJP39 TaxID=3409790 RepID=UPI003BB7671E
MKKVLLTIIGIISLVLGIIGIILPLLPTTPLLLLAAACFVRSSDRLYQWLITNKWFGPYIKNYRDGKGIPLKAKIISILLLWISMGYTIFIVIPLFFFQFLLFFIGGIFTWVILKQKTLYKVSR